MAKIKINGTEFYYEEHGQGKETVLLIHGLFMNCRVYDQQIEALQGHYRVVVYDLRGQGQSEVTAAGYGLYEQVEDAANLIKQLECAPCHVAGMSMGGYIGLRLAKRHPQLVRSLTLISTSAAAEAGADAFKFKFLGFIHRRISQSFAVGQVEPILFGEKYRSDPAHEKERAYWHQQFLNNNKQGIAGALNGLLARDNLLGELGEMEVPTLIISGDADLACDPLNSVQMNAELPHSQLLKIPEVGHTVPLEAPEVVNSAVVDFLVTLPYPAEGVAA
jgi:3-oxoadipate enol-lactonase